MSRWSDQVRDEYSRPVPGVSIYVYKWDALAQVAGDLETLTDDTSAPIANPVVSDDDGIYYFNSLDGQKLLELHYGGKAQERELILVGALPVPQATIGGLFVNAAALTIPAGMDMISTTGYSALDVGAAIYVYDAAVNSAYVTAHPRSSFISLNGLGFRLSLEQDISPEMLGVTGLGVLDEYPAFQATVDLLPAAGGNVTILAGAYKLLTTPTWGVKDIRWNISPAATFTGAGAALFLSTARTFDAGLRTDLAAPTGSALIGFKNAALVGAAPTYIRTAGEKAGEVISLIDLAGIPTANDYTSWFTSKLSDYPYKTIRLPQGTIQLAGAGVVGVNNIILEGFGDSQSVLMCPSATLDMLTIQDAPFWRVRNLSLQRVAGATAGRGVVFTGTSSSCKVSDIFATLHPGGAIHFIGNSFLSPQSGNKVMNVVAVDNGDKQIYFKWSNDWSIDACEVGRVNNVGYAPSGFYLEESSQGTMTGSCKAWDNVVDLYMLNCLGNDIDDTVRLEQSRNQNIVIDGGQKNSVKCRTYTPNRAAGLTPTYSAVHLKGNTQDNEIDISQIFSEDSGTYLMHYGVEIDSGCHDNRIIVGTYRNNTAGDVGGVGATNSSNSIFTMQTKPLTVGTLPAAGILGRKAFVTDANATTFQSIVAAGGANKVPVYDDGTNWRIG